MAVVLILLGYGLLLGIRHAFDADHIAAVSTILSGNNKLKKSSMLGLFWGFGHTASLLAAGLLMLLLKIPLTNNFTLSFEFIVGVMLVALGINALVKIKKDSIHFHRHKHDNIGHIHFHSHKAGRIHKHPHIDLHKSMIIGLLHGIAGSAALTLLVLAAVDSLLLGATYIVIFGIGSMIGMAFVSSIISLPILLAQKNFKGAERFLKAATGIFSIFTGIWILHGIIN